MKKNQAKTMETFQRLLKRHLPELRARYGVKSLSIFGSYVHGNQSLRSDVDLLVEFDERARVTLVGFVALERELAALLGHKVDLVEKDALKPVIGKRILGEVVPI